MRQGTTAVQDRDQNNTLFISSTAEKILVSLPIRWLSIGDMMLIRNKSQESVMDLTVTDLLAELFSISTVPNTSELAGKDTILESVSQYCLLCNRQEGTKPSRSVDATRKPVSLTIDWSAVGIVKDSDVENSGERR